MRTLPLNCHQVQHHRALPTARSPTRWPQCRPPAPGRHQARLPVPRPHSLPQRRGPRHPLGRDRRRRRSLDRPRRTRQERPPPLRPPLGRGARSADSASNPKVNTPGACHEGISDTGELTPRMVCPVFRAVGLFDLRRCWCRVPSHEILLRSRLGLMKEMLISKPSQRSPEPSPGQPANAQEELLRPCFDAPWGSGQSHNNCGTERRHASPIRTPRQSDARCAISDLRVMSPSSRCRIVLDCAGKYYLAGSSWSGRIGLGPAVWCWVSSRSLDNPLDVQSANPRVERR